MFTDKVVLITGAASGFGKLLAERLSEMGAKLALADLNAQGVSALADELGENAWAMTCNVANEDQMKALADGCVERFGRLDIAVNNAGISTEMKSLLEVTEKEMDINFAVNAKSVLFGMKHQIPHMLAEGGCILNVASMAGLGGAPKLAPYSAAKHAVIGLTKTAAVEFGAKNIRINAICPFFTHTPMIETLVEANLEPFLSGACPMKRLAEPAEIVNAMLGIISPDNSYLHGQCIAVDGGVSAF
ncbi:4-formylbenzenesulfonate dehydrogenase TsaC1/TsaC2 [Sinobacterium norvegicum]|uniref:4-formylbenzenesulfonate dehydrogenase TsaC1/TsaC2 n=1 Tax=Sinobacterium norvegicum TaxID=1641715 RepID=A0ABM9ABS9_9GAMM|nr:SDR family oxidoreductase [Sinobacterium norvegicum]CAH0990660.1 4-formylbenzenesulfonate dehydrogenase TsaC1/TsaC2 [Sinobacterium norvegicum]